MSVAALLAAGGSFGGEQVRAWKASGGAVVGYSCVVTPVEILEAAGVLPFRLRALGNARTDLADARLARFNCGFCRALLQLGLDGTYDFLDGLIETNGCDHLRGMFENWCYARALPFFHYVKAPHVVTPESVEYFAAELREFAAALSGRFGRMVTEEALRERIAGQARIRGKLRALQAMREAERPAFSGSEVAAILLAGSSMPAAVFEPLLDAALREREGHRIGKARARLVLCGSATEEIDFLRGVEAVGALLVSDSMCYSTRAFWPFVSDGDGDPYLVLARTYLANLLCPRMFDDYPRRLAFVLDAVARARADGVVCVHNKFCDVHGADNVALRLDLERRGIPVLQIEKEYGAQADLGRMKTRIQAFLERIGGRR